jgi:cytochrome c peroxidase
MKKSYYFWLLPLALFFASLWVSSYKPAPLSFPSIPDRVKEAYLHDLRLLEKQTFTLSQASKGLVEGTEKLDKVQALFIDCRKTFKKIEFLAEYLDPEYVKKYINGAPLPRLSTDDNRMIEAPEGLQTIEELLFSENPLEESEKIISLTRRLHNNVKLFVPFQARTPVYHQFIFEAARLQLIRVFTLSLTGFDTPVASDGIEEARISLSAIADIIAEYQDLIDEKSNSDNQLTEQFQGAIQYLEAHPDFDSFDRLHFLTNYINPLFEQLWLAHRALGIPTQKETTLGNFAKPINQEATNIFANNLLNPFFFADQTEKQYRPEAVELGKLLFFDPILSENNERSCASCHQPEKAFTDGLTKSIANGFDGTVSRNSPTLINAVYSPRLFYDMRAEKLEKQIHHVVFDPKEFDTNFRKIFDRLNQSPEYQALFKAAYPELGNNPVHQYSLTSALGAYIISLRGFNSPFDQYVRGEKEELPESVKRGFNLFMGKAACGTCHFAPTFTGLVPPQFKEMESEILGVPASTDTINPELDPDLGRAAGRIKEGFHIYAHSFKTSTVRNIEQTAPYMHNGVYQTLEEVMDFYNKGGGTGLGLDVPDQTLPPDPLGLDKQEISDIIDFMKALNNTNAPEKAPERLPSFPDGSPYNGRKVGGVY